jgi:hypothetical protein
VGWLRRRVFGIDPEETSAERRGFRGGDGPARCRLQRAGLAFVEGYHAALDDERAAALATRLDRVDEEDRGFAYEGAAMGLRLLDHLSPWGGDRLSAFLAGPGSPHLYMMHVGAGWATARLRRRVDRALSRFDPLLRWLVVDGYGFHQGYFQPRRWVDGLDEPAHLAGYARRAFDQGLGRSLWFVEGADVAGVAATIARFPRSRRPDLWSGVGLACAYAGGATEESIRMLRAAAGADHPCLAQGAAFAAKARSRAGNPSSHTESACLALCDMPAEAAAELTDAALVGLGGDGQVPAYEVWRGRIRSHWGQEVVRS